MVIVEGVPNLEIHPATRARATASAVMHCRGIASCRPACEPVDAGKNKGETVRWREWADKVDMYLVETDVWGRKGRRRSDRVSMYFGTLAVETVPI